MRSFYQHLAGGLSTAAALGEAKRQMLHREDSLRHPYYWAPFVLIGQAGER